MSWYADEARSAAAARLQGGRYSLVSPMFLQVEIASPLNLQISRGLPRPADHPTAVLREPRSGGIAWTPDTEPVDGAMAIARRGDAMIATFGHRPCHRAPVRRPAAQSVALRPVPPACPPSLSKEER
jgi:hypothetical protein